MWVQFPTNSDGSPTTTRLAVTVDGERVTVEPTSTGTAQVAEPVGEHLVRETAVTERDPDDTDRSTDSDSASDSTTE